MCSGGGAHPLLLASALHLPCQYGRVVGMVAWTVSQVKQELLLTTVS